MTPPTPVQEFPTLAEGFANSGFAPFYVPAAANQDFAGITEEFLLEAMRTTDEQLYGYDSTGELVYMRGDAVAKEFLAGTLRVNFVDAPLATLEARVPRATLSTLEAHTVSPVVTSKGTVTPLHIDPLNHGGGWIFLAAGEKRWVFVDPEFLGDIYDSKAKRLIDVPDAELIRRAPATGLCLCHHRAGGFVYFPPAWAHQVTTFVASLGIGGYGVRQADSIHVKRFAALIAPNGPFAL